MSDERILPTPPENIEHEEYWAGANEEKLLLPRCKDTNQFFWYPRKISPFTLSGNVELVEGSGKGTIYSYSYMRRTDPSYVIAYVELEEGIRMMTNIVDCDPETVEIGQAVEVVFRASEGGQKVPVFKPVG